MADVEGGRVIWDLDVDATRFTTGLAKASSETAAFGSAIGKISFKSALSDANASFSGIANGIAGLAKSVFALGVTSSFGLGAFVKTASGLQTTNLQMQALIGNTQQANAVYGQLYNYVLGKPIAFPDAAKAAATLLGYGRTAQQVIPDLKTLSTLSIVNGADLNALSLVYGQVTSRGALFGQDALQLINNKIPLTNILAKQLGVSMEEAAKKIDGGQISAIQFTKAMDAYAQSLDISTFSDSFQNRMISLNGSVRAFGNTILGLKIDPVRGLVVESGGLFDRISQGLTQIGPKLSQAGPLIKNAFTFLFDHGSDVVAVLGAIAAVFVTAKIGAFATSALKLGTNFLFSAGAISQSTAAMLGFDAAADANPIGAIVLAVEALIAALVFLQLRFDIFGRGLALVKPVLDPVVGVFQFLFRVLGEQLAPAFEFVRRNMDAFKVVGLALLAYVLLPIISTIAAVVAIIGIAIGAFIAITFVVKEAYRAFQILRQSAVDMFNGSLSAIGGLVSYLAGLPGRIVGAVGNLGSVLYGAGRDLIQGLLNGAGSLLSRIGSFFLDKVPSWIRDPFTRALGIHSPSTVFAGYGKNIAQGLVNGINSTQSLVSGAMDGLSSQLGVNSAFGAGSAVTAPNIVSGGEISAASAVAASSQPVVVNLHMDGIMTKSRGDMREIAKDMLESVNEELRARRLPQIANGAIAGSSTAA